jgi:hypothetical protein
MKCFKSCVATSLFQGITLSGLWANPTFANAQCVTASQLFRSNTAVQAMAPQITPCTFTNGTNTCQTDYAPISINFMEACLEANGFFSTRDMLFDCVYHGNEYYMYQLKYPVCVTESCTETDLEIYFEAKVHPEWENYLYGAGYGQCRVSSSNQMSIVAYPNDDSPVASVVAPANAPTNAPVPILCLKSICITIYVSSTAALVVFVAILMNYIRKICDAVGYYAERK